MLEMTTNHIVLLLTLGLVIGVVSGMVGVGGGIMVIPALMLLLGFTQARANGTSLAMLMFPIGILAVLHYHRAGNVEWRAALLMGGGYIFGALAGAWLVNGGHIPATALRVGFALLLMYSAGRLLFRTGGRARAAWEAVLLVALAALVYFVGRLLARKMEQLPKWVALYQLRRDRHVEPDYEI